MIMVLGNVMRFEMVRSMADSTSPCHACSVMYKLFGLSEINK